MNSKEFVVEAFKNTMKFCSPSLKEYNVMVAGGVFTSAFTQSTVNDIDCYFHNEKDLIQFLVALKEDYGFLRCTSFTDKSLTLIVDGVQLQLIYFQYFKDLYDVFNCFDFTVNMCGYDFGKDELVSHEDFFVDLSARRLSFNTSTSYPLVSALRIHKYTERGFKISRSETIKVLLEVAKLQINSIEDFVSQVGGMYGNSVMHYLDKIDGEFTTEKAMKALAKSEVSSTLKFEGDKPTQQQDESVDIRIAVSALINKDKFLDGGWYVDPENSAHAKYKEENGRLSNIPVSVAYMFAKDKQVFKDKSESPKEVVVYKWVKEDENGVLSSVYVPEYKYPHFGEVVDAERGCMYFLRREEVMDHYFKDKASHLLVALVDEDDVKFSGKQLTVGKATILYNIPKNSVNTPSLPPTVIKEKGCDVGYTVNPTTHKMYIDLEDLYEEPLPSPQAVSVSFTIDDNI